MLHQDFARGRVTASHVGAAGKELATHGRHPTQGGLVQSGRNRGLRHDQRLENRRDYALRWRTAIQGMVHRRNGRPAALETSIQGALISVPWSKPSIVSPKGVLHSPSLRPAMNTDERDALLNAIAKARAWIDDLVAGQVDSFGEIAKQ